MLFLYTSYTSIITHQNFTIFYTPRNTTTIKKETQVTVNSKLGPDAIHGTMIVDKKYYRYDITTHF